MRITAKVMAAVLAVVLLCPASGDAQRQRNQGKTPSMIESLPEDQKIDTLISEMLAAWQLGDVDMMKSYYADDVSVVSGAFEPPVMGWAAYAQAYRRQRERIQAVALLERVNTLIKFRGNLAWVTYQWAFSATVDGQPLAARGHTTLVMEKRGDRWYITHNHTSIVPEAPAPAPAEAKPGPPNR
ncbi:MAG TPA: nuclear transport factor 2 family protein [Candidatus Acidoferrales bacterium]